MLPLEPEVTRTLIHQLRQHGRRRRPRERRLVARRSTLGDQRQRRRRVPLILSCASAAMYRASRPDAMRIGAVKFGYFV